MHKSIYGELSLAGKNYSFLLEKFSGLSQINLASELLRLVIIVEEIKAGNSISKELVNRKESFAALAGVTEKDLKIFDEVAEMIYETE